MFPLRKPIITVLIIGLIVSLWFNYLYFQQQQRIQSWKKFSYNQFVSGVVSGGKLLGYETSWYDANKASLAIGEAATVLKQWSVYLDRTNNQMVPHIEEVANYLSYIALILVDPNQGFEGDSVDGEKYVKNLTNLLIEELEENGAISDITNENEIKIFNAIYNLIPEKRRAGPDNRIYFFYLP